MSAAPPLRIRCPDCGWTAEREHSPRWCPSCGYGDLSVQQDAPPPPPEREAA